MPVILTGCRGWLSYIGESANEPVISRLIKNFDLNVGILFGSLDDIKGVPFGQLIISLVGESAMAGAIGGGGLGDLAIRYGYQRFRPDIMIATVVVLIVMVQVVQFAGNALAKKLDKR